jgi:hypothetical protein
MLALSLQQFAAQSFGLLVLCRCHLSDDTGVWVEDKNSKRKDGGLMAVDIVNVKGAVNTHYQIRTDLNTKHNYCDSRGGWLVR